MELSKPVLRFTRPTILKIIFLAILGIILVGAFGTYMNLNSWYNMEGSLWSPVDTLYASNKEYYDENPELLHTVALKEILNDTWRINFLIEYANIMLTTLTLLFALYLFWTIYKPKEPTAPKKEEEEEFIEAPSETIEASRREETQQPPRPAPKPPGYLGESE